MKKKVFSLRLNDEIAREEFIKEIKEWMEEELEEFGWYKLIVEAIED